jgi:hypothetical protein
MARRHLSYHTPTADGPLQAKLDEHDDALDALEAFDAASSDLISRQTLGADAQEITFNVSGDADECVEIEGFGESNASANVAIKANGTALNVARISQVNGGAPAGSGTNAGATVADSAAAFHLRFHTRRTGTADRVAILQWVISYGAAQEEMYWVGLAYEDTSTEITTITISGSVAATFAAGFKAICRRRKMSA